MTTQPLPLSSAVQQRFKRPALTALTGLAALTVVMSGCANGPEAPKAMNSPAPVSHNCQPQETVGFSCELRDHRLLSLCASPGFEKFEGLPKDNPGYAYLVVGTTDGAVQYSYPPNPADYKQHMYKGVPTNGIPFMFVASEKGPFLTLREDDGDRPTDPGSLEAENLPPNWSIDMQGEISPCVRLLNFDKFADVGPKMMFVGEWSKRQRNR